MNKIRLIGLTLVLVSSIMFVAGQEPHYHENYK